MSQPPTRITLYPSAFVIGGYSSLQLATNSVRFAKGDTVVGAPTSEDYQTAMTMYQGQATPADLADGGYVSVDAGPQPMTYQFGAFQNGTKVPAPEMFEGAGSYNNVFSLTKRPANNGAVIYVQGNNPVLGTGDIPYSVFADGISGGALIHFPASPSPSFSFNEPLGVAGLTNTGTTTLGPSGQATVDTSGNIATSGTASVVGLTDAGTTNLHQQIGPATAPTGSCATNGAWVFSQDGHATFCAGGTWITKI
jgi:hypothetical protein